MPITAVRAFPARPVPAPPSPQVTLTGNRARDLFEKVEYPDRFSTTELEVAAELRKRIVEYQTNDAEFLRNSEFEFDFLSGLQWMEEEGQRQDLSRAMASKGRSAFTIDLLTPSVELVVNGQRINKLTANFIPVGGKADDATADIRQGLYRNIERVSKAAIARETAYQMAVSVGRGYERILIEDEDGPTFTKKITIQRVDSLQSIAIDTTCLDFTYKDAAWAYAHDDLWKQHFEEEYRINPDDPEGDPRDLDLTGRGLLDDTTRNYWFPKDKVKVGEYFRRQWKRRDVLRLADGTSCWADDAPPNYVLADDGKPNIKSKMDSFIEWRKMTGTQTLEKRIWPGKMIPIVVFIGREVFRGKKPKIHSGLVRSAMAPCRIHNYMISRMVDEVALSPLPHLFAPENSLSPEQEAVVNDINSNTWSVVTYKPQQDDLGRQLPAPQWASPSPNIAAVAQSTAEAKDNLQRVLNTYAPQLGRFQGSESGRAMREVKDSGDISHAAFPDNFNRAVVHEAEIVNELMDVVYTDAQAITITDPDEKTRQVLINQEYIEKKSGKTMLHLFGIDATYGVAIQGGPSYPTRMAESAARILDLAKVLPAEIARVLDLVVKDLNIPNSDKYADRLRPPGFKSDDDMPSQQVLMQQIQDQEQNAQRADALIQQLLHKIQELGSKESIQRLQIASKERIAAAQNLTTLLGSEIKAGQEASHAVLMAELEFYLKQLDTAQDVQAEADQMNTPPPGGAGPISSGGPGEAPPGAPQPVPAGPSVPGVQPNAAPQLGPTGLNPPQQ